MSCVHVLVPVCQCVCLNKSMCACICVSLGEHPSAHIQNVIVPHCLKVCIPMCTHDSQDPSMFVEMALTGWHHHSNRPLIISLFPALRSDLPIALGLIWSTNKACQDHASHSNSVYTWCKCVVVHVCAQVFTAMDMAMCA
jgi:hypothetical protein